MFKRSLASVLLACGLVAAATPADAQLNRMLNRVQRGVNQVSRAVQDARAVRCDVQGVCGNIQVAAHFDPASYQSVAVTLFDETGQFSTVGVMGQVRDAFEGPLVRGGYRLAANTNPQAVQGLTARGSGELDPQALAQVRQFIAGVDAVIVVHLRQLREGACKQDDDSPGVSATLHIAVRWLNADVGDVPWLGTHQATACAMDAQTARGEVVETVTNQLAGVLPSRAPAR